MAGVNATIIFRCTSFQKPAPRIYCRQRPGNVYNPRKPHARINTTKAFNRAFPVQVEVPLHSAVFALKLINEEGDGEREFLA
jgi:hypothetical protein